MTTTQKRRVQGTVRKEGGSFSLNMLLITTAGRVRLSCMKFWFLGHALANDTHRFALKTTKVITAQISIFYFAIPGTIYRWISIANKVDFLLLILQPPFLQIARC